MLFGDTNLTTLPFL